MGTSVEPKFREENRNMDDNEEMTDQEMAGFGYFCNPDTMQYELWDIRKPRFAHLGHLNHKPSVGRFWHKAAEALRDDGRGNGPRPLGAGSQAPRRRRLFPSRPE